MYTAPALALVHISATHVLTVGEFHNVLSKLLIPLTLGAYRQDRNPPGHLSGAGQSTSRSLSTTIPCLPDDMANDDNAHPSSEDELFVSTATEPMAYTFQSDLSDDEIEIATAQPAPKPISPAASIADRSRAFPDSDAAIPDPQRLIPSPAVAEDDDPALFLEQAAAALAAVTKADTSTKPKKRESELLASWRGSVNALANGVTDHNIAGTRRVDIEVALPWLPPSERAAFTYVEVEDSDEGTKHYDTRRRRNKVSDTCLARY